MKDIFRKGEADVPMEKELQIALKSMMVDYAKKCQDKEQIDNSIAYACKLLFLYSAGTDAFSLTTIPVISFRCPFLSTTVFLEFRKNPSLKSSSFTKVFTSLGLNSPEKVKTYCILLHCTLYMLSNLLSNLISSLETRMNTELFTSCS